MKQKTLFHRIAFTLRRVPFVMGLPYAIYKFWQPKYTIGVMGVVFNDAGQVLIVEHVFHPYRPWGLPGGWIGRNENPEEAVARELKEELELEVRVTGIAHTNITERYHLDMAFLCQPLTDIGALSFELLNYRWCDVDALPNLYPFQMDAVHKAQAATATSKPYSVHHTQPTTVIEPSS